MSSDQILDCRVVAAQCLLEHQILQHVRDALRLSLSMQEEEVSLPRKLSSVRFTFLSYQRHLNRIMDLEENGGYMEIVREMKPNLWHKAEKLQQDHHQFRSRLENLVAEMQSLDGLDQYLFRSASDNLVEFLEEVEQHEANELNLMQEVSIYDEGGEG